MLGTQRELNKHEMLLFLSLLTGHLSTSPFGVLPLLTLLMLLGLPCLHHITLKHLETWNGPTRFPVLGHPAPPRSQEGSATLNLHIYRRWNISPPEPHYPHKVPPAWPSLQKPLLPLNPMVLWREWPIGGTLGLLPLPSLEWVHVVSPMRLWVPWG